MSRAYPFMSGFACCAALVSLACGGGGGDAYDSGTGMVEQPYQLARFEFSRGYCSFDSIDSMALAEMQFPVEFAQCRTRYVGTNTFDGERLPAMSWPSTSDLGGSPA